MLSPEALARSLSAPVHRIAYRLVHRTVYRPVCTVFIPNRRYSNKCSSWLDGIWKPFKFTSIRESAAYMRICHCALITVPLTSAQSREVESRNPGRLSHFQKNEREVMEAELFLWIMFFRLKRPKWKASRSLDDAPRLCRKPKSRDPGKGG